MYVKGICSQMRAVIAEKDTIVIRSNWFRPNGSSSVRWRRVKCFALRTETPLPAACARSAEQRREQAEADAASAESER
jgi:hypothetical protein